MICTFSAPDMESARLALRDPDTDLSRFWPGTVHAGTSGITPTVVVERSFAAPVRYEDIEALGDAKAWCFETYRVKYSRTVFSLDRKRMLCFYSAPDAEAVRNVQREAGAAFQRYLGRLGDRPQTGPALVLRRRSAADYTLARANSTRASTVGPTAGAHRLTLPGRRPGQL